MENKIQENKLQIIDERELFDKEFRIYGTPENPLFLAKDVANWIEHSNVTMMLKKVDEYEVTKHCLGGLQGDTWFLTEDGLYEVLMQSRKPIAKQFKKKVKEILKTIRKTGGFVQDGREEEFIDKYFPSFSEEVKLSMVQDLLKTNKELKPKAEYHDNVLNPTEYKKLVTTTDIAKDLGMSAQKLNKLLHKKEIIFPKKIKGKTKGWYLYSKYEHLVPDYADYQITEHGQTLKWSEKGRKFILDLLKM